MSSREERRWREVEVLDEKPAKCKQEMLCVCRWPEAGANVRGIGRKERHVLKPEPRITKHKKRIIQHNQMYKTDQEYSL